MKKNNIFLSLLKCNKGVTAIEYGLFAALLALVMSASLALSGKNLSTLYCGIAKRLGNASACPTIEDPPLPPAPPPPSPPPTAPPPAPSTDTPTDPA